RLGLRLADAHVERDLLDPRHLHDRRQPELVLQARAQLLLVLVLEPRRIGRLGGSGHQRSTSCPQSARRQPRTFTFSPLTSLIWIPIRVGRSQAGQTIITFETLMGAGLSMTPPGSIVAPPIRLESLITRGVV